jgi:hypothetical protein
MIKQEQLNEMFQPIIGTSLNEISFTKEYVKLVFYGRSLNSKVELEIDLGDEIDEDLFALPYSLNNSKDFKITKATANNVPNCKLSEIYLYLYYLPNIEEADKEIREVFLINQCTVKANAIVWRLADNNITRTVMRN